MIHSEIHFNTIVQLHVWNSLCNMVYEVMKVAGDIAFYYLASMDECGFYRSFIAHYCILIAQYIVFLISVSSCGIIVAEVVQHKLWKCQYLVYFIMSLL